MKNIRSRKSQSLSSRVGSFTYKHNVVLQIVLYVSLFIGSLVWTIHRYNAGATVCYDSGVGLVCEHKR